MFKFIVTWVLSQLIQDPCPNSIFKDDYGRTSNILTTCLVNHCHRQLDTLTKEFTSRKDAEEFVKNAGKPLVNQFGLIGQTNDIVYIKLDSVKIK